MLPALLVVFAFQRQPRVVDAPVFRSPRWGVAVRRPFDDWVFAPDTASSTATIIFQPASAHLDDQLWGAVILARWGGPVPLDSVAERRLRTTWRPVLGSGFALLARETTELAGWPAVHLVVTGAIRLAVVDIEEFLVARGNDLVVLQLRYPRGVERDSIARGYRTVIDSLDLGPPPGREAAADAIERCDTSARALGRAPDSLRIGRLGLTVWRDQSADSSVVRVDDSVLARVARTWGVFWNDFGPLPTTGVSLVETRWPTTLGCGTTVFLGRDLGPAVLSRELSRAWWGGSVRADQPNAPLIEALAGLSALLVTGDSSASVAGPLSALLRSRALAGEPRFEAAVRVLVLESRGGQAAVPPFLAALGDTASAPVRQLIAP